MISEDKIIKSLQAAAPGGFIGDDAAVLPNISAGNKYVITKDLLTENIHFRTKYFTAASLAHKALHVNLSDLAAMGAQPLYILCGISIPSQMQDYAVSFLNALNSCCQEAGVILIGGDTTAAQNHLLISITAIGIAPENNIKYRNAAKSNDLICIVGNLGFAHLGFIGLENTVATDIKYINSFLRPEAKIKEGIWLSSQTAVSSMMDVSDGLYIDLKRLALSSKKCAVLDIDLLQNYLTPDISLKIALEGGEDYGLLVTIHKNSFEKLSNKFKETFGYGLKVIGHITSGDGISFKQNNQKVDLAINPFTHFGEKL